MRKVRLKTLGCKVNQYETQAIREKFLNAGYSEACEDSSADVIVVNTCTVTGEADRKSRTLIRKLHRENSRAVILVTGCYATGKSSEAAGLPGVKCVVPNHEKCRIVEHAESTGEEIFPATGRKQADCDDLRVSFFEGRTRAFLKIQDGCNRACSYCKVCQIRGPSRSRSSGEILDEANRLAAQGYKEIVLVGIQLGAYGKDLAEETDLDRVLKCLAGIEGIERIRLSSIDPSDVTDSLIEMMKGNSKICPQLHISLQSGDDGILKAMRRSYCAEEYRNLTSKLRREIPDFALTTDVLVGFPGETDARFENTVSLLKEICPLKTHIFPFSPREGTPAYFFKECVDRPVIQARVRKLQKTCNALAGEFEKKFLGKISEVLIEGEGAGSGWLEGHTSNYLKVRFAGHPGLSGKTVAVKLDEIRQGFFWGTLFSGN